MKTETPPAAVTLWQANNPQARDFRVKTIGKTFHGEPLKDHGGGVFVGKIDSPLKGWTAFFIELTFSNASRHPLKITSGVRVVPDTLPYPPPK